MIVEEEIGEAAGLEIGRRRRWSLEDKRAVVEVSLDPECADWSMSSGPALWTTRSHVIECKEAV